MPRKKDGMLFEVHPTPVKGRDGRNIVYVRPVSSGKLSMQGFEDYCSRNYGLRYGELSRALEVMLRAGAELMAQGYRIETPIGSFAAKLKLTREMTDPDEVMGRDVSYDGVDYNPGKTWHEYLKKWDDGFRRANNPNTQEIMADEAQLEKVLEKCIRMFNGYVTTSIFAYHSGLTKYSARKQLNRWTEGENPKLLKTRRGQEDIYTEI